MFANNTVFNEVQEIKWHQIIWYININNKLINILILILLNNDVFIHDGKLVDG